MLYFSFHVSHILAVSLVQRFDDGELFRWIDDNFRGSGLDVAEKIFILRLLLPFHKF